MGEDEVGEGEGEWLGQWRRAYGADVVPAGRAGGPSPTTRQGCCCDRCHSGFRKSRTRKASLLLMASGALRGGLTALHARTLEEAHKGCITDNAGTRAACAVGTIRLRAAAPRGCRLQSRALQRARTAANSGDQ